MALLVYVCSALAVFYRYSYLIFAPEPVELPQLDAVQLAYFEEQALHKWVWFCSCAALHTVLAYALTKSCKGTVKQTCVALTAILFVYFLWDVFDLGVFDSAVHVLTCVFCPPYCLVFDHVKEDQG